MNSALSGADNIMSHNEEPTSISTLHIVRHYWRRRLFLIILTPLCLALAVIYVKAYVGDIYESTGTVMVRTPPSSMRRGPTLNEMDPPVYEDLFKSDELLRRTIQATREKFPDEFPQTGFEKMRALFSVKSLMTRDTATQTAYSPVLTLTVQYKDPDIVHFLAEQWVGLVLERYGNLRASEASEMQRALTSKYDELAGIASQLQQREAALEQQLRDADLRIEAQERILLGSGEREGEGKGGLFEEIVRLQLEIAQSGEGDANPGLSARLAKAQDLAAAAREESEELGQSQIKLKGELEQVRNQLVATRAQMVELRSVIATAAVDAAPLEDPLNPGHNGELLLLSKPVQPEVRVAPQKSLIAVAIAAVLLLIVASTLLAELYVRRAMQLRDNA
jgi:hypothetical protein